MKTAMRGLKTVGAHLRAKREDAGMTCGTLADITRVPVEQIVLIEQGNPQCDFDALVRLGYWFEVRLVVRVRPL